MRILFLSRRFPPVRLGYVTEVNRPRVNGKNAVQGLGKLHAICRYPDACNLLVLGSATD